MWGAAGIHVECEGCECGECVGSQVCDIWGYMGCRVVRSRSMWDLVGVSAPIGCCGVFGMWDLGGMYGPKSLGI